jgi:adenylyltransferase/sulfurtransferase
MEVQPGKALMINGLTNDIYLTEYPIKEFCMSHSTLEPIVELPQASAAETTLAGLLAIARETLGPEAVLEFDSELVVSMICGSCVSEEPIFQRMARLYEDRAICPTCGAKREMRLTHRITGEEEFLGRTLAEVDVPPLGIIRARNEAERVYYELTGDKATFLQFE